MGEVIKCIVVVNLDWDNIWVLDIMVVVLSFVFSNGCILNVIVYLSEFGRECMEYEEVYGFLKEIFFSLKV